MGWRRAITANLYLIGTLVIAAGFAWMFYLAYFPEGFEMVIVAFTATISGITFWGVAYYIETKAADKRENQEERAARDPKDLLSCKQPGCDGVMIPMKFTRFKKRDEGKVSATCSKCHGNAKLTVPLDPAGEAAWAPHLGEAMFTCPGCNQHSLKLLKVGGTPRARRIEVECVSCEEKGTRVLDAHVFHVVSSHLPPANRLSLNCGTCNAWLQEQPRCPRCGREVFCSACGSYVHPSTSTCPRCGRQIDTGDREAIASRGSIMTG